MTISLDRYYGSDKVTKSVVEVTMAGSTDVVLKCEAREPMFRDYSEKFPGCSKYCLACGQYECKVVSTDLSPMTLTVVKSPGHRCCRIFYDEYQQVHTNQILLGQSDGEEDLQWRDLVDQEATYEKMDKLVYDCFVRGERIVVCISNHIVES